MKTLFISGVAAIATFMGGAAIAADLPAKAPAPVVARPACAQFGGFYVGANAGWATLHSNWLDRDAWVDNFGTEWAIGNVSNNKSGGTAGGQIGYNWQLSPCTVFGVEVDANWVGISDTRTFSPTASPGTALTLSDRMRWFGTARTRGGVIVDNVLIYVTGGFAYANIRHDATVTDPNVAITSESINSSKSRWGGVLGVGTEYAFNRNWSLKGEALYIQFADKETTFFSVAGNQAVRVESQDWMWVGRIGLNYRF